MAAEAKYAQFMEYVVDHRIPGAPAASIADIIDGLIWITDDNGGQVCSMCESWLLGDDPFRAEIALSVQNVFFFESHEEMMRVFSRITERWPSFQDTCLAISRRRRASVSPGGNEGS